MLYTSFELTRQMMQPARSMAAAVAKMADNAPMPENWAMRANVAGAKVFDQLTRRYTKPEWELPNTEINGTIVPVKVETVVEKPFGSLLRFRRDRDAMKVAHGGKERHDPRILVVAPMSGHYATLLRGTVQALLPDHEVFITDWADARNVPVFFGRFDLNDYIDYLIDFFTAIGPGAHSMAVCQPGPPLLASIAVMSAANHPATPKTHAYLGSPIDARRSPTVTNLLAEQRAFEWFERNMVQTVPAPYAGIGRRVYPGFLQLTSFMSMNLERHANAMWDYFENLIRGEDEAAEKHERFYDEYFSVCDMTSEFYLQTISDVFQEYLLARGLFQHRGELVDPGKITKTALMTIEGELDDISGIGQTQAAHDLCSGLSASDKIDYVQEGAGHYGVFSGSKWRTIIKPKLAEFIRERFDEEEEGRLMAQGHLRVVA